MHPTVINTKPIRNTEMHAALQDGEAVSSASTAASTTNGGVYKTKKKAPNGGVWKPK